MFKLTHFYLSQVLFGGFFLTTSLSNDSVKYETGYGIEILQDNIDHGYVLENTTFTLICLVSQEDLNKNLTLKWSHKNMEYIQQQDRWIESHNLLNVGGKFYFENNLTIFNSSIKNDSGEYKCLTNKNFNSVVVKIVDSNFGEISLFEESNTTEINVQLGDEVVMVVEYFGYPNPIAIVWISPDNSEILNSNSYPLYKIETEDIYSTLIIKSAQLDHNGKYTVLASNIKVTKKYEFNLKVESQPRLKLDKNIYVSDGNNLISMNCSSIAYPRPDIIWVFKPCEIIPVWPTCKTEKKTEYNWWKKYNHNLNREAQRKNIDKFHLITTLTFKPIQSGLVECRANNSNNNSVIKSSEIRLINRDIGNENFIRKNSTLKLPITIAPGFILNLECNALAYNYRSIAWYKNNTLLNTNKRIQIMFEIHKKYYYKSYLIIDHVEKSDHGDYECRGDQIKGHNIDKIQYFVKVYGVAKNQPDKVKSLSMTFSKALKKVFGNLFGKR